MVSCSESPFVHLYFIGCLLPMFSSISFYASGLKLRSWIHLEFFIFYFLVHGGRCWSNSFFCMWISSFPSHLCWMVDGCGYVYSCLGLQYCQLVYRNVFMLVPLYFYCYVSVIHLEVWHGNPSSIVLFACLESLPLLDFFLMWILGFKLRSSCLSGKHISGWAFSPSPFLFFLPPLLLLLPHLSLLFWLD